MVVGPRGGGPRPTKFSSENAKQLAAADAARNTVLVDEWFAKFDRDVNGFLDKDELKALLQSVAGVEPNDKVMAMAWVAAKVQGNGVMGISKGDCNNVLVKTVSYIKESKVIDPIFAKYDLDKNSGLDEGELLSLLRSVAKHNNVSPDEVTEADVKAVFEMVDSNESGLIEKDEVLLACARWKNLYLLPPPDVLQQKKQGSTACSIL